MKGITASMLREATYSSVRMGFYDPVKNFLAPNANSKDDFTLLQKIMAGKAHFAFQHLFYINFT